MIIRQNNPQPDKPFVIRFLTPDGRYDQAYNDVEKGIKFSKKQCCDKCGQPKLIDIIFERGENQTQQIVFEPAWPKMLDAPDEQDAA